VAVNCLNERFHEFLKLTNIKSSSQSLYFADLKLSNKQKMNINNEMMIKLTFLGHAQSRIQITKHHVFA